jgi:hypothetical protein
MARGQAVIWMPGRGILKTEQFPLKSTFDSSRTPKRSEAVKETTLAALDIGALRSKLAAVEAETKANDPRELKAEIAKLKAELARAHKTAVSADPNEIAAAEQRGFNRGIDAGIASIGALAKTITDRISDSAVEARRELQNFLRENPDAMHYDTWREAYISGAKP